MALGDKWNSVKFPDGCRGCGQTQYRHIGNGLCNRCYRAWSKTSGSVEDWLISDRDVVLAPPVEELDDDGDLDVSSFVTDRPGEVRPGSSGSPLTSTSEPAPGVEPKKKGLFSRKEKAERVTTSPKTREPRPTSGGRRTSASDTLSDIYGAVGGLIQRLGASPDRPVGPHAPLGRYLSWQAPMAGEILDNAIKDTFVDKKMLQPAVRARSSFDAIAALFGPPAIIVAIERNPERANVLIPVLENAIRSSLPTLLPAMKKSQDRQEKIDKSVREMFPDMPIGEDPVHAIIEQMFGGYLWSQQTEDVVDHNVE